MRYLIIFFTFFYMPCMSFSQGIWKTYTKEDGLAGNDVACINQDKLGNYWLGTNWNGLSKLDTNGIFTNYFNFTGDSLGSIMDIEIDSLNNKWLVYNQWHGALRGTYVVKFDDSTFTYYKPTGESMDCKPSNLGQDSLGQIWCGTSLGVAYWFDGEEWHEYYVPGIYGYSTTTEITTNHYGRLYFSHLHGISTMDQSLFGPWWTSDIAFDRQNRLWFATIASPWGLGMFDGENWYAHTTEDGLLNNNVASVAIDSCNNIWICYATSPPYCGVSKFNDTNFFHFNYEDGLAYDNVQYIFVDKKGNIWFGTGGRGVSVLHDTTTDVNHKNNPSNIIKTFTLFQNYPNPFNNSTLIKYILNIEINVKLSIYNLQGKEVRTLVKEQQGTGLHQVLWHGIDNFGKDVSSGIYIAVLKNRDFKQSIKLSLIR